MLFISHNVDLGKGIKTMPESDVYLIDTERWKSIERTINFLFKGEDYSKLRVVDLGCLEGGYSLAFAQMGFQVVGIDVRDENLEKCEYVKKHFDVPNLTFVKDDVKNLAAHGKFDIIFCAGILYHVDEPAKMIKDMADQCIKCTIVHTHYASSPDSFYDNRHKLSFMQRLGKRAFNIPNYHYHAKHDYRLSDLVKNEGYLGRWFFEFDPSTPIKDIEKNVAASYSNNRSFWLLKSELIRCSMDSGFKSVYEQYDFVDDHLGADYIQKFDRSMFVLVK